MSFTPIIAITCDVGQTERLGIKDETLFIKRPLAKILTTLNVLPVITYPTAEESHDSLLAAIDGLILSGSVFDIPPELYGQKVHQRCGACLPERSRFELSLLKAALAKNMPVLGICGGFQLINVALGGTLFQDYTLRKKTTLDHTQHFNHHQPFHEVQVAADSLLATITGQNVIKVNSTHHQLIDQLGNNLYSSGQAPDGVIEAIEIKGRDNLLAVQWHPEYLADHDSAALAILRWFAEKAKMYRQTAKVN